MQFIDDVMFQGIVAARLTQYQAFSTDEVCCSFQQFPITVYIFRVISSLPLLLKVMALLQRGNQNRTTEPSGMNETSSRSHAILQVCLFTIIHG